MRFIARFRFYAPFNAMLIHVQMPGAAFVALPHRWEGVYGRRLKPEARALVILQPIGPVLFIFDVSDAKQTSDAPPSATAVRRSSPACCRPPSSAVSGPTYPQSG